VVVICPHLIDQMSAFCRCALDPERDHCGIYSELCRGNGWPCFADLGPWGAWRAVLWEVVESIPDVIEMQTFLYEVCRVPRGSPGV
jgi:hypothetical protein